jgi:hypothetical protein
MLVTALTFVSSSAKYRIKDRNKPSDAMVGHNLQQLTQFISNQI